MAKSQRRSKLQKGILAYLAVKPVKILQEIAGFLESYPSSVSRSIKLLQKEGLIKKSSSGYQLTDKGREITKYPPPAFTPLQPSIDLSMLRVPKEFFSYIENIRSMVQNWDRQIAGMYKAIFKPIRTLQKIGERIAEFFNIQIPYYVQIMKKVFVALKEQDEEQAVMLREINKELIQYGWVFSPSLPAFSIDKIHLQLKDKGVEEVIKTFSNYFSNQVCKEIIEKICSKPKFSNRSHIIRDAFQAHYEGKYTMSIPVFLAQAGGAFMDHFREKLYHWDKKKYLTENKSSFKSINVAIECFDNFIREVLARSYGIEDKIPEGIFARHLILHGRSVDYGIRENSIKAILLLDYVSFIISLKKKNEQNNF